MTQEAIRMRAGEDDRMDVRIAVCAINQFFQLFGDRGIKQRMRAAVDTSDKHPGVALNGDVSCGLRVHFTPSLSLVQSRWSAAEELDGDEGARGGLAGGVAVEEQELLRIRPGQGRPQDVEVGDAGDLIDVLAALRAG